jgi:predicted MFS family arabinose efflux permease
MLSLRGLRAPNGPEGEIAEVGSAGRAERATFRHVFAVAEFRALWSAQMLSVAGDQLARVALTWLVYDRTRSALLAAITYVSSIVPVFIGGVGLSGLGDRFPRRQVMIACDLIRAVLVIVMAVPGMPVAALVVLLFAVTMVGAPFTSARAAIYPDILTGDRYVLGTAVTITTYQFAQVIGFAVGGTIVGVFGVRTSLIVDSATFAGSALIVRWRVRPRPAAEVTSPGRPSLAADALAGARLLARNPALRAPLLFGWLAAFYNVPEGVVAPLARMLGGGSATVGLLLAAAAFGAVIGSIAFSRLVDPPRRLQWMGPLSVIASVILALFFFRTDLLFALLILAASGFFTCFQLAANAAFVSATPPAQRSQAFGLAQGVMSLGQGTLMVLAGAAAEHFAPTVVIAATGVIGTFAAAAVAISWSRRPGRT